jgi:hypothetical protein
MLVYLLFMLGIAAVVWGLPALVFLLFLDFPIGQSLLFGFLAGSLMLGLCEALGLIARARRFVWPARREAEGHRRTSRPHRKP